MIEYGIQMYSIRDVAKENLKEALRMVAEMGYKYVEFAGFFGNSAEDVKSWLDEYGLKVSGTHTHFSELIPFAIEKTIAYHKTIGCDTVIIPSASFKSEEDLEFNIALFNYANKVLRDNGLNFAYHNHSREFYVAPYGKTPEEEILNRTDIDVEIDTFWLYNAGIDPIPFLEKHKDRIKVIHLKDGVVKNDGKGSFADSQNGAVGKSIGSGNAPVLAVRDFAIKNNILMVVESETLDPSGPEEVKRCIDFLKSLEA